MEIRKLKRNEFEDVYNEFMKKDFPSDELKPLSAMLKLFDSGKYFSLGLYDGDILCGYAYFCESEDKKAVLLDYYAIRKELRSKGYGSLFLNKIKEECKEYNSILIEAEKPEFAKDAADKSIRNRRVSFYNRAGCVDTKVCSCVFGVYFVNFQLVVNSSFSAEQAMGYLSSIYKMMLPSEIYKKEARFWLK
jgi:GNAT superfamily N-acetyltransferase